MKKEAMRLLLFALLLGGSVGPGAGQSASPPVASPGVGIGPMPAHAAAALILPASGDLGQVILPQPAGPDGIRIRLTSSNPKVVSGPAGVLIPAGANSVTFQIGGLTVAEATRVTITADTPFGPATATTEFVPSLAQIPPVLSPQPDSLLVNGRFGAPPVPAGQARLPRRGIDDLPGWRLLHGPVDLVPSLPPRGVPGWPPAPESGRQSLDLAGGGIIEQSFPTEPGRTYLFSGWISHTGGIREGRVTVSLDGQPYVQLDHAEGVYGAVTLTDRRWAPFSCPFRATGAATTLTLTDITALSDGAGAVLDGLSVTPIDTEGPPLVPATPLGLTVKTFSSTQVSLTWLDWSEGETALALWRRGGGTDWIRIAVLAPHTMTFTDTGLTPVTIYSYRLRAINRTVASDWSNEAIVTTQP